MVDRPILFSAPMVRALIAGTKTQTRRIINPQPERLPNGSWHIGWQVGGGSIYGADATDIDLAAEMLGGLRIQIGDRLWVREAWRTFVSLDDTPPRKLYEPGMCGRGAGILYEADDAGLALSAAGLRTMCHRDDRRAFGKIRASMHLPRWASRLTLIVTDVRVQRLQDISEEDARAEGVEPIVDHGVGNTARHWIAFNQLWDRINGPASWITNPWVAAYTFTVHVSNIDTLPPASAEESR